MVAFGAIKSEFSFFEWMFVRLCIDKVMKASIIVRIVISFDIVRWVVSMFEVYVS